MIKITDSNKLDIARVYSYKLLDDMDYDTLYSFAYSMLVDNKESMSNEGLENEILDYYPEILENN